MLAGNTQDKQTLRDFLQKIEDLYGKADRIWVMDRGILTEEVLAEMRQNKPDHPPVHYIVGTPKGRLTKYEKRFLEKDWEQVRPGVEVKHLEETGEQYVLARSSKRVGKERSIAQTAPEETLGAAQRTASDGSNPRRPSHAIGSGQKEAGRVWNLVKVNVPESDQPVTPETFTFTLQREKLRTVTRRDRPLPLESLRARNHGRPRDLASVYRADRDRRKLQESQR